MDPLALALIVSAYGLTGNLWQLGEDGQPVPRPVVFAQAPVYTNNARRARVQGQQWVVVKVRTDGTVESAEAEGKKVPMGLASTSEEAAKQWRFAPSDSEHSLRLRFEFKLAERCDPKAPSIEWLSPYSFRMWERMPEMPVYAFGIPECKKILPPPCPEDGSSHPPSGKVDKGKS
jgi:hypothetical protein